MTSQETLYYAHCVLSRKTRRRKRVKSVPCHPHLEGPRAHSGALDQLGVQLGGGAPLEVIHVHTQVVEKRPAARGGGGGCGGGGGARVEGFHLHHHRGGAKLVDVVRRRRRPLLLFLPAALVKIPATALPVTLLTATVTATMTMTILQPAFQLADEVPARVESRQLCAPLFQPLAQRPARVARLLPLARVSSYLSQDLLVARLAPGVVAQLTRVIGVVPVRVSVKGARLPNLRVGERRTGEG